MPACLSVRGGERERRKTLSASQRERRLGDGRINIATLSFCSCVFQFVEPEVEINGSSLHFHKELCPDSVNPLQSLNIIKLH